MSTDPKKRGLGRGLGALLPSAPAAVAPPPPAAAAAAPAVPAAPPAKRVYFTIGIEELHRSPEQPRRQFDESKLGELGDSLRVHGVITPLVVRPRREGGYYMIAGERRWRAAQKVGITEVPVVVADVGHDVAMERALVENLQRADLGPLEEAAAYQRLVDELDYTQDQIAERIGKDRSTVANTMRLLKLPPAVRQLVEDEQLSMGHARALLGLDDAAEIERAARTVVGKGLSVRATEALVKGAHGEKRDGNKPPKPSAKSPEVRDLEEKLTKKVGGQVTIHTDGGGGGRIEIRYGSLDHLDQILDRLL